MESTNGRHKLKERAEKSVDSDGFEITNSSSCHNARSNG